jgi:putative exporter of polyketide antibiotics
LPRIYDGGLAAGFSVVVFLLGPLLMLCHVLRQSGVFPYAPNLASDFSQPPLKAV